MRSFCLFSLLFLMVLLPAQGFAEDIAQVEASEVEAPAAGEATAVEGEAGEEGVTEGEEVEVEVDELFATIQVVPGLLEQMSLAIPTPRNGSGEVTEVGEQIGDIVRRDLHMSGLFAVISPDSYQLVDTNRDGMSVSTIDFDGWFNVGASVLIKGSYTESGDTIELDLKLFDTVGEELKLNWSPTVVRKERLRATVHDFSNAVIEFYTGEPGIFGTRILFAGPSTGNDRKIFSIENDGWGLADYDEVTEGLNILPTWGPGGGVIYARLGDDGDLVYVLEEGVERALIELEDAIDLRVTGADYCSSKDLVALTISMDGESEIYTVKTDGTELTEITNSPDTIETSPSWAPGCKKLAFVSDRSGRPQIYIKGLDGGEAKRITWLGNYNTTPEWSPKGDLIAFTARDERRAFDVFTVNVSTGEFTRITQDQGNNEEPSWSPDGRYMVFQSTRDGRQPRLYMATSDGRWQVQISEGAGFRTPVWQR